MILSKGKNYENLFNFDNYVFSNKYNSLGKETETNEKITYRNNDPQDFLDSQAFPKHQGRGQRNEDGGGGNNQGGPWSLDRLQRLEEENIVGKDPRHAEHEYRDQQILFDRGQLWFFL